MQYKTLYQTSYAKNQLVKKIKSARKIRANRVENIRFKDTANVNVDCVEVVNLFAKSKMLHPVIFKICSKFASSQKSALSFTRVQTWLALNTSSAYLSEKESLCYGVNAYLHGYDCDEVKMSQISRMFKTAFAHRDYAEKASFSLAIITLNNALKKEINTELLTNSFLMFGQIKRSKLLCEVAAAFQALIMILHQDYLCAIEILREVEFSDPRDLHQNMKDLVLDLLPVQDNFTPLFGYQLAS